MQHTFRLPPWRGLAAALLLSAALPAAAASWLTQDRPGAPAREAVAVLLAAAEEGLDPADYDAAGLQATLAALAAAPVPDPGVAASFGAALDAAMQRYLLDVHSGRVDPRRLHPGLKLPPADDFDPAARLDAAVAAGQVAEAARAAAPALPLYARLREALATYRRLAADAAVTAAWQAPLPLPPRRKLEPGQTYDGLAQLARRLTALGDLGAGVALPARYEGVLVDAVRSFQTRHGLDADGVLGRGTLAQLEIAPAARVRQLELTMERLRWTPLTQAPRMVVVNVPEFALRAYEVRDGRIDVRLQMKVIVGKALDTRTPLMAEDMRYIEFSPYWNVPPSIARAETVPKLRHEPGYFAQQGFEFVAGDGSVIGTLSAEHLDAVLAGELRIRQRPGPKNALGDIKFVFPNNDNIYLHHTPTPRLFERARRDFSHGCIRVEEPVALARFVLQDVAGWDEARIRETMSGGKSRTLRLDTPLPVLITYGTAMPGEAGRMHFLADIYGHDKLLDEALRRAKRSDPTVAGPRTGAKCPPESATCRRS